ncbi:Peptidase S9A/B/C oligopeptidase N-terminal beta-propeller [Prunus yedoensis var. nudiflora]|uniref:Prolyl endopeptidase n=1 Tax=Prunus yedoensis var. nudiflora TaxID=2094558 RepID=A0A314XVJ6_PRUYE|nr:Peptidase S9A/B/C oligopeptidase N-terminal beta-propeller [Prunus yedoensis var. nudiflora]
MRMVMRMQSHRASRGVSFVNLVQQLVYLPAVVLSSIGASASITVRASSLSSEAAAASVRMSQSEPPPPPPMAKKVEHKMEMFGDVRVDNYYWLRDDSRSNPDILSYLQQENAYTQFLMSGTKKFEDELYAEIRGRIKEDDISAPERKGPYYYYQRTLKGKEYVQHCRRLIPNCEAEAPLSVYDTMPTGPDAPPEHVILDENIKAQHHDYYSIAAFKVSPNNKLVAYAEDTKGNEIYTIHVIDAETGAPVGLPLVDATSYLEWAGDEALVYITMDETLRPDKAWLHKLGTEQSSDSCLYHEKDDIDHLVVYEREEGLPKVTIYHLPDVGQPLKSLHGGQAVNFLDPAYSVDRSESEFSSGILRFSYSSMKTPPSVYDYDLKTGISVLKKIETVLGGFEASNYVTERKWASAPDRTQIPISIVYRKDLIKLDGSDPLLLYGYGSYEVCIDPSFKASRLSLLNHGFIYAIAHIRGGGEMGRQWYENGKLLKKKNTFTDFIACAEYLIEKKYCSKARLCIDGRSAGGLLIGAVLNMRPDLFKAAVAGVPFVDVLTTMLDPTIPLTTSEWEEWGDPRKEEFYFYMKSYSPVDNVKAQNYPNILVTAGLNDPRVMYSEPAKFVAKLRDMKTDKNIIMFKCELGAGHFSKSGRFEKLQEDAFIYTFIMKALDMVPAQGSGLN